MAGLPTQISPDEAVERMARSIVIDPEDGTLLSLQEVKIDFCWFVDDVDADAARETPFKSFFVQCPNRGDMNLKVLPSHKLLEVNFYHYPMTMTIDPTNFMV